MEITKVFEEMVKLNEKYNLNIELMDVKESNHKKQNADMLKKQSAKLIEKRSLQEYLIGMNSFDITTIKLDVARELNFMNVEEVVKSFKDMTERTTNLIAELEKNCPSNHFMIVLDNLDCFVKEMQNQGVFLDDSEQTVDRLIREVFKVQLTEWQKKGQVTIISDKDVMREFIGGDVPLKRRIQHHF